MKSILYALSFMLLLASCKVGTNQEQQAVKKIAGLWGGKCTYGVSTSFSTEEGKRKVFNLTLAGSPSFNTDVPTEVIASNMAWTIYNSWAPDEKEKYTHISVTLEKDDDEKQERKYEYTTQQLKTVTSKEPLLKINIDELKEHRLNDLFGHMDPSLYSDTATNTFAAELKRIDSTYGRVTSYKLVGFNFSKGTVKGNNIPILVFYGTLIHPNEKMRFSLYLDLNKKAGEYFLYGFQFSF